MTQTIDELQGMQLKTANPSDRIALRGVRLRCRVAGISAKTTLEQTFVNLEDRAIEAVYTFPLPDGAAACGFEVVFFDKVFTGVIEETDKAVEKYDDAIAEGHGAYLVEQHRPDVFSVRVGNLKPRQAVTIRLTYVMDLDIVDKSIRLAFPTTIAPRYATATGTDPIDAAIDGQALNPPHVLSVPNGISAEVEIDLGKMLAGVTSPSHKIEVTRGKLTPEQIALQDFDAKGGCRMMDGQSAAREADYLAAAKNIAVVTLAGGIAEMDRDIVLNLQLTKEREPAALSAIGENGEKFVAVSFVPEFDEEAMEHGTASETVFVLDCSGSMGGESIQQAMAALECCLRSMSGGDTFNICRFGSTFEMLASEPLKYSQHTLESALAFIRQGANLGGTELLPPLEAIFASKPATGQVRNLVLLTDGQVSNEPAVIALARRKRLRNRIFTFGIGAASSAFLVKGLARVSGGASEFIANGERIEDKVLRTFGRLASPPVTDVEIDWGNADAQIAPKELPPIFDGDGLRVYALIMGRLPDTVTLNCKTPAGPRSWSVNVRPARDALDVLPKFWARAAIRTIEDEQVQAAHSASADSAPGFARLIEISKKYNIASSRTSFIAVEHRSLEDRNEGKPELRRVPVMLAAGWGGVDVGTGMNALASMAVGGAAFSVARACALPSAMPMASCPPPSAAPAQSRARKSAAGGIFKKLGQMFGGGGANAGADMDRLSALPPRNPPASPPAMGFAPSSIRPSEPMRGDAFEMDALPSESEPARPEDSLVGILGAQDAEGEFASNTGPADALLDAGFDAAAIFDAIDQKLALMHVDEPTAQRIRPTLRALIALRLALPKHKAAWKRAARKGAGFASRKTKVSVTTLENWIDELASQFAPTA